MSDATTTVTSPSSPAATAAEAPLVQLREVVKTFEEGRVRAVDGVDIEIEAGEFVAIVGPSGCGKSTLLNLIAALDIPEAGSLVVAGHNLGEQEDLNEFRACDVGLVFQLDNLLPSLTALENVQVPMFGRGLSARERRARAEELLELVELTGRSDTRPPQLSGGERQRVAIARALANRPPILLADEPTGRLDSVTSGRIMDLIERLCAEQGMTVIVVSHDPTVAARAGRVLRMLDGKIEADERRSA